MKASLSATFIDERFNIFQKVYLETEMSLKKEAPRKFYFPTTPKAKIAELEKIVGVSLEVEKHVVQDWVFPEAKETGNLA